MKGRMKGRTVSTETQVEKDAEHYNLTKAEVEAWYVKEGAKQDPTTGDWIAVFPVWKRIGAALGALLAFSWAWVFGHMGLVPGQSGFVALAAFALGGGVALLGLLFKQDGFLEVAMYRIGGAIIVVGIILFMLYAGHMMPDICSYPEASSNC
jgi:hypothetical protein